MKHKNIHKLKALAAGMVFVSTTSAQLTVTTGASIFIGTGASVVVQGNMTNAGSITGSGTLLLQGSSLQTVDGTGSINNLTLNNSSEIGRAHV